jgi:hypothetical protein
VVGFGDDDDDDDDTTAAELAPTAPTPSRPARADLCSRDFDFERDGVSTSPRFEDDAPVDPEYLDLDAAALEEARRAATRATATATTLMHRAKEILDVVSGAKRTPFERGAARLPRRPRFGGAKTSSRESSGVRTPTRVERGTAWDARVDVDVSSPAVAASPGARKRGRAPGAPAADRGGDSTDMEDSDATEAPLASARLSKRHKVSAGSPGYAPKATDSIITADGQKVRRGCLNCGCQKTPQWRMGPTGPKTLCNACGVRFRKGVPMHD